MAYRDEWLLNDDAAATRLLNNFTKHLFQEGFCITHGGTHQLSARLHHFTEDTIAVSASLRVIHRRHFGPRSRDAPTPRSTNAAPAITIYFDY